MGKPPIHRVFRSVVVIAALTLLVRAVGLAREILIAKYFGTSDELDAYLTAFVLPTFITNVLAGSLNAAFIPVFITVQEGRGKVAANRLLGGVLFSTSVLLAGVTLVSLLAASKIIVLLAPGFGSSKLELAIHLSYWLSPIIVLQGIITIWSAVLNANEEFGVAAFLPAIATGTALAFLFFFSKNLGIYSLAIGFLAGFMLQALVLGWRLESRGYRCRIDWDGWTPELRRVLSQYIPMIMGAFLMSGTNLVEQFMAASLLPGSVSSLGYAVRLTSLANGIFAMALGTAILPHFSVMVARADWAGVRHTLKIFRWSIFLVGGAATVAVILTSEDIVKVLFLRGNFTLADVAIVSALQRWYAIQLPFCAGSILLVRLISALGANSYLMWGSLVSLVINILLNNILTSRMGLNGVAITNSFMYMVNFIFLSVVVARLLSTRASVIPVQV